MKPSGHFRSRRPERGRALFYTRDSGGEHEMTPGPYVEWTQRRSTELGLKFGGSPAEIKSMIHSGVFASGDLFIDYGIQGDELVRPGLEALFREARRDPNVTHVFIPRPDRLLRPLDSATGLEYETTLRRSIGVWIIYKNRELPPLGLAERIPIHQSIESIVAYDKARQDLRDLAEKAIDTQRALAQAGFSTGGRAKYGLKRTLVGPDGKPIRDLADGEIIRLKGHHVVWTPGPPQLFAVRMRIIRELHHTPASRLARILSAEGILSPDAGRYRTDNGIKHPVSGVWHATTISNIGRDPINAAFKQYGKRSIGKMLRYDTEGYRELQNEDFRDDGKPKVVINPEARLIQVQTPFVPAAHTPEEQKELVRILDQRGKYQRGKPRSRSPEKNPLGARVFDMNCGWPMYRYPKKDSYGYWCGLYLQSHAHECQCNRIDGLLACKLILGYAQQLLLSDRLYRKLENRLREIAARELKSSKNEDETESKQIAIARLEEELSVIGRNMALAKTEAQHAAMAKVFDDRMKDKQRLEKELEACRSRVPIAIDPNAEVAAALCKLHELKSLAEQPATSAALCQLFAQLNARLFLRFTSGKWGKRTVRKPSGGMVTFGAAPPPIEIYHGPTARKLLQHPAVALAAEAGGSLPTAAQSVVSGEEGISLRNPNRGDKI